MTKASPRSRIDFAITPAGVEGRWFLRPNDIAHLSGIKATTIRDAIYRGDLPARKFRGRGWLITADDARRWIDGQSTPSELLTPRSA